MPNGKALPKACFGLHALHALHALQALRALQQRHLRHRLAMPLPAQDLLLHNRKACNKELLNIFTTIAQWACLTVKRFLFGRGVMLVAWRWHSQCLITTNGMLA
jgi:hypothetical protein